MNKKELISRIVERTGIDKTDCELVYDAIASEIEAALISGEPVMLRGLLTAKVSERKERQRRNPTTGKIEVCPATKTITCKISESIKQTMREVDRGDL